MSLNKAAWSMAPRTRPLEVRAAPMSTPGDNQILIKNHAIAINPIDAKMQQIAMYPVDYPAIFGQDVAGEVVAIGPNVTRFKKGQRVLGNTSFPSKRSEDKGFQAYTILNVNMTSEIPSSIPMERAVVIPTGLTTAASGLFQSDFLNLRLPTAPATSKSTNEVLLIWGGASSVGCNAIQLAVAAGYDVFTAVSPRNFDLVKKLGASHAFDYQNASAVSDLLKVAKGRKVAGAFDACGRAVNSCVEFVQKADGVKLVACTMGGFPAPPEGIKVGYVYGPSIADNHVAKAIYEDFLPKALEAGTYVPAPEPLVSGKGLECIQGAMDLHSKGVSARKVVVLL
ncbi:hypothetical protein GQX73_g452 [Xylaria multiplex]|uniref:Enoyl reductase (ER) domain-containing protein n=1 Tax=Xylaria multiplex TaxID=323545 RepID=A0A7C8NDY6_9PEZI|nr:hypothetical protein GQX73_g452 [Xylaria multiplex]